MVTKPLAYGRLILQAFGLRGIARRAVYVARLRSGGLARRLPAAPDFHHAPPVTWSHRFDLDTIRLQYTELGIDEAGRDDVVRDAERLLAGEVQLYGDRWHNVGWPPRWHVNPFTQYAYPRRAHWTKIPDDDPEHGDIKDVWELSRLPFSFILARAHVLTGDDRYPEGWWHAIESWAAENPPNVGVNWRCGQETSLRAIALCFGLSAFADHPSSTPVRSDLAARILGASATRVGPTVGYALSQRNNHAVSELVFLLSVGAGDERRLLRLLLEVLDDQFYPDGSYSQQSFTYQRLAVQALQWLLLTRPDLPPVVRSRVVEVLTHSRDFLDRCSDPVSGWLPNYGANDGGMLFHLSNAHYRDFRPFLASLGRPSDPEHREPSLWISLPDLAGRQTDADAQPTTYQTLRGPRSLALSRIGTGRHRPGHADQQALDLWIDGRNVVVDPGTFRYTAAPPWGNALTGPEVHATPRVPDEALLSVGRFLTEAMPDAEVVQRGRHGELEVLVSRRHAQEGWLWRALVRRGDAYAIVDVSDGVEAVARWNFGDVTGIDVVLSPSETPEPLRPSDDDPASGWASPLYGSRHPVEARVIPIPSGSVVTARFTPTGQPPVTDGDLHDALAGSLPPWALTQVAGGERAATTPVGCSGTHDAPEEA